MVFSLFLIRTILLIIIKRQVLISTFRIDLYNLHTTASSPCASLNTEHGYKFHVSRSYPHVQAAFQSMLS